MGAFNLLKTETNCPQCGKHVRIEVQFKFGDLRQYEYRLGDKLLLHESEETWASSRVVLAAGIGGPCPNCGADFLEFDVRVNQGVLEEVSPHAPDVQYGHSTFLVKD